MTAKNYSLTCPACKVTFPNRSAYMGHGKRSSCTDADRFWARVNKAAPNGCWEWTGYRKALDYGYLGRTINGKPKPYLAHRYAWMLLGYPLKDGELLLHKCDNPPCVNPAHLFIGDDKANAADKIAKGRGTWGDLGRHKLTREQAETVLREYRYDPAHQESNAQELAARYGVRVGAITNIVSGRSWPYLDRSVLRRMESRDK